MEFLPTPFLYTEHEKLKVSMAAILLQYKKALSFSIFTFNSFSVVAFFHYAYFISTSSSYEQEASYEQDSS